MAGVQGSTSGRGSDVAPTRTAQTNVHSVRSLLLVLLAQASAADHLAIVEKFKQYDSSGNGYLSGNEVDACGCRDVDGGHQRSIF